LVFLLLFVYYYFFFFFSLPSISHGEANEEKPESTRAALTGVERGSVRATPASPGKGNPHSIPARRWLHSASSAMASRGKKEEEGKKE